MKRVIAACILSLAGFAAWGQTSIQANLNEAVREYVESQKPLAESGQIKWSDYLSGLYDKQAAAGIPPQLNQITSRLLRDAQRFEKGEISQEDFQFARREGKAQWEMIANDIRSQQEAQQQAQRQARLGFALQIMQNRPAPQPLTLTPLQPTNALPFQAILPATITALKTGNQQQVQTITNQPGWSCEYSAAGRTFWRTFTGICPQSIQVQ